MSIRTLTAVPPANGEGAIVVRPQQTVGVAAEQARAQAEIQSALMVAAARPRDEMGAIDRIGTSCQRVGLAECAEYSYSRGGTEITGPTIDLLTVVANHWGNISYGFRELSETAQESVVESFAWDLESNAKRAVTFTIKHVRHTKNGTYPLTDPRDRYENLANLAQRRVRACLEAIIPPDVVEAAVQQCRETLKASADVTPEAVKKLTAAFVALGVTKEQVEKRLGRRIDTIQPAQLVSLRRVYKSIQDGMSKPADWFDAPEGVAAAPASAADAAKDALRSKAKPPAETADAGEPTPTKATPHAAASDLETLARMELSAVTTIGDVEGLRVSLLRKADGDVDIKLVNGLADARANEIRASRGTKSNKE